MKPTPDVLEWLQYAENDYRVARLLVATRPAPYEIMAFHCQQAAEKNLKAILVSEHQIVPRIHDLVTVFRSIAAKFPDQAELENACFRLTPFGTISRYPGSPYVFDDDLAQEIVRLSSFVRSHVRAYFELPDVES